VSLLKITSAKPVQRVTFASIIKKPFAPLELLQWQEECKVVSNVRLTMFNLKAVKTFVQNVAVITTPQMLSGPVVMQKRAAELAVININIETPMFVQTVSLVAIAN